MKRKYRAIFLKIKGIPDYIGVEREGQVNPGYEGPPTPRRIADDHKQNTDTGDEKLPPLPPVPLKKNVGSTPEPHHDINTAKSACWRRRLEEVFGSPGQLVGSHYWLRVRSTYFARKSPINPDGGDSFRRCFPQA